MDSNIIYFERGEVTRGKGDFHDFIYGYIPNGKQNIDLYCNLILKKEARKLF